MIDSLFDTPEKIQQAVADLQSGIGTPFWNIMCKIIDGNIAVAKDQLENGTGEETETPESIARIRDRLKLLREIRNTPEEMIKKLELTEEEPETSDPYAVVEETVDKLE